jgi:hypothetical protein
VEERRRVLSCECQFVIGSYIFPEDLRDPESSTCPADVRIPVDTGRPPLFRLLKTTASCVLASLNATTYWKVRLGISLAAALLDGHFEQPAGMKQALPFQSSFFQMLMIPHRSRGC